MGLINGLHHVSMKCCDREKYDEVVSFYGTVLGLPAARTWDGGIMFETDSGLIEIFTTGNVSEETGIIRHFAFSVNNVDDCVKAVTEAGYEVFMGPKDIEIPSTPTFPARMAFCFGPLGEQIEFFQEK